MSTKLSAYDYPLPKSLIAKRPLPQRDASRMMVLDRSSQTIEHRMFRYLPEVLRPRDLLILNDTRVLPARRFSDDGAVEFLFLEKIARAGWKCLVKPGRKMRVGAKTTIGKNTLRVERVLPDGARIVSTDPDVDLFVGGTMPLPPYIGRASDVADEERYQTVFARTAGAVAAPTAGLHFTHEMLATLPHTFVTLHVGPGTFRPVQSEDIAEHRMHSERFWISSEAARKINGAGRVIAIGTTVVRVLESAASEARPSHGVGFPSREKAETCRLTNGRARTGETDIFIRPPFDFRVVDALLTNFHLPKSTLLMLVSAFAGREFILRAYAEAIRERYRFYSYGDCMLIL